MFLFLPLLLGALIASGVPDDASTDTNDSSEETWRLAESFLNGRILERPAEGADYCAFLIGHAYGNHLDRNSRTPARSLLASIESINEAGPVFVALRARSHSNAFARASFRLALCLSHDVGPCWQFARR